MDHLPARPLADRGRMTPHVQVAAPVVVVVVGFRNAEDVGACMRALAGATAEPGFEVFITENGGALAMDALLRVLCGGGGRCREVSADGMPVAPQMARRCRRLCWHGADGGTRMSINVAEARENLGYAGGVNAWLRPLLAAEGWQGAWILNPDAEPTPTALAELVAYAAQRQRGMVGSRLEPYPGAAHIHSRGLAWHKLMARTEAVDFHAPCRQVVDEAKLAARLDAPSGASLFITRATIEAIGLMDERYFLYFEDLDWGLRAKRHGGIGYAHTSVVPHTGGTTTRTTGDGRGPSPLTVYLEFRNRILFVRRHYSAWLAWTLAMQVLHAVSFATSGSFAHMRVALRGLAAGVRGEEGRPDRMIAAARLPDSGQATAPDCDAPR